MKRYLFLLFSFIFCWACVSAAEQGPPEPDQNPPTTIQPPKDINEPLFPYDLSKMEQQNSRFFSELLSMLATLGLVIAFLIVVAWFLKRLMNTRIEQMNAGSRIKIVERRMLSNKSSLYMIDVEGKSILITESQHGCSALDLTQSLVRTPPTEPPKGFKELI